MAIAELEPIIRIFSSKYGQPVGDGLTAAVFRLGDRVRKVYSSEISKCEIFKEANIMARIEAEGISAPRVHGVYREDGLWILEMDYIEGVSLLQKIMEALTAGDEEQAYRLVARMACAQAKINLTRNPDLPSTKAYVKELIVNNPVLTPTQKDRLTNHLAELPDGDHICHGDLHPNNYLVDGDGKLIAIDWPEVGCGVPACDAARTYLNLCHPAMIRNGVRKLSDVFLDAYCEAAQVSRQEIQQWLPIQAGTLVGYKKKDFSDICAEFLL